MGWKSFSCNLISLLMNERNADMHFDKEKHQPLIRDPLLLIHNCHGYHNGLSYIPVLLESSNIVLLQEHWL